MTKTTIDKLRAREVLDSRGNPTVEVELTAGGRLVRALVPSGASTGSSEALELRDGDKDRYLGKGVLKAVGNVNQKIAGELQGKSFESQQQLDDALLKLDGTDNKSGLGANALLGVSMAFARAHAESRKKPLYQSIAEDRGTDGVTLPVPLMNILNGGAHADNGLAIQEFMIVPAGFEKFSEALRAGAEVFHHLKKRLKKQGLATGVGDEGGFAPVFSGQNLHQQVITTVMEAIGDAGYEPGKQIYLALDVAATEFASKKGSESLYDFEGSKRTASEMVQIYKKWVEQFPIVSIEDALSEDDWSGWGQLTQQVGSKCQLVGDDLFVTNVSFLKKGIESQVANSILIKVNQIGTVSETIAAMKLAADSGYSAISSHRSGETEDTFIADLAVGTDCGQIKTGSASRTDRIAKYNQLLRIEEELGARAKYAGRTVLRS